MSDIKVGDRVRSYDFPHTRDCYIEGVVEEMPTMGGCRRYKIRADRIVLDGVSGGIKGEPGCFYPPVNGTPTLFGVTGGVEKIELNLPVAITYSPPGTNRVEVVQRVGSVSEAEAYIAELHATNQVPVERGDYGIDAPEDMVNPRA